MSPLVEGLGGHRDMRMQDLNAASGSYLMSSNRECMFRKFLVCVFLCEAAVFPAVFRGCQAG